MASLFKGKINTLRPYEKNTAKNNDKQKQCDPYYIIKNFESDRGRVINSAAIRRLQQKTQVFPLERNSFVRTRLTHSMEVQQIGRYIVKEIFQLLSDDKLKKWELTDAQVPFESLVEIACLMHDIGNPPFGHFGESAIGDWFSHYFNEKQSYFSDENIAPEHQELAKKMQEDLCNFEGNAQAIRLVYSLLKLNLTYSQTASILKYTRPAYFNKDEAQAAFPDFKYLLKKPGYYLSEEAFIEKLYDVLQMGQFTRFPLTYIMEAADDISYCLADLEDAVEKNIFTVEQLYEYLKQNWTENKAIEKGDLFIKVIDSAFDKYQKQKKHPYVNDVEDYFFRELRVGAVMRLVSFAAKRFVTHLPAVFAGTFNASLLDGDAEEVRLLNTFKSVSYRYVFIHESIGLLELQGSRIINGLFDIYSALLALSADEMKILMDENGLKKYPAESHLFRKLPRKYLFAYQNALRNLDKKASKKEVEMWEFYYRCRLLQDYVSGMTDLYAYEEYQKLMVINIKG